MRKSELINYLQEIEGDFEVTTSDRKGSYSEIKGVELQKWGNDEEYASITLVLGEYDSQKLLIRNQNSDFIDKVNECLEEGDKIDKEEALNAEKQFENDFKDIQSKCKRWFNNNYHKLTKDVMLKLFNDDEELRDKSTETLKKYVYKNGWQNELSHDSLDNRSILLRLLYSKVDGEIKSRINPQSIIDDDYTEDVEETVDGEFYNLDMSFEDNNMENIICKLKKAINDILK